MVSIHENPHQDLVYRFPRHEILWETLENVNKQSPVENQLASGGVGIIVVINNNNNKVGGWR